MHQRVEIIGYLGKEPEMRYTTTGQAVTKLSVATSRSWKDAEGDQKETCWFRVSVWGRQAEACNNYLQKGSLVFIEGRLVPDRNTGGPKMWKGNDDMLHTTFEVTASHVTFLSSSKGGSSAPAAAAVGADGEPTYEGVEQDAGQEEIPF
jgi:single-strand DNA-binding protein